MTGFSEIRMPHDLPLEGPPKNAEDSLFLSMPELASAAELAVELRDLDSSKAVKIVDEKVKLMLSEAGPERLINFLDALSMLEEVKAYNISWLREKVDKVIEKFKLERQPVTRKALGEWLTLYSESSLYAPLAEKFLKKMVNACRSTEETVNLFYDLLVVGLRSSDQRVIKKTLEIVMYLTPVLKPEDRQAMYIILSYYDANDEVLKKISEIDTAVSCYAREDHPDMLKHWLEIFQQNTTEYDEKIRAALSVMNKQHPGRLDALRSLYEETTGKGGQGKKTAGDDKRHDKEREFLYNLLASGGELRGIANDYAVEKSRNEGTEPKDTELVSLHFPEQGNIVTDAIKEYTLAELILRGFSGENLDGTVLQSKEYWETVSHQLPPEIRKPQVLKQIGELNERLREEMRDNTRYLLSPRGDLMEITDQHLKDLGFNKILFELDQKDKRNTMVTLEFGTYKLKIKLDQYFFFRHAGNEDESLSLPDRGNFITNIILSHLHQIRCSEEVNETGVATNGVATNENKNTEGRRAFTTRRAHIRRLPEGHSPTIEQIARAWEIYGMDIVRVNRERAARGEAQNITFVFEAQNVAIGGNGPVRSQAPKAMDNLWELIKQEK